MEVKKNYSSSNVRGLAQKVTQSLTSCAQPAIKKKGVWSLWLLQLYDG